LETINRLTILEQIDGWQGTQAKLGGDRLLGIAIHLRQNELTRVFRRQFIQYRGELQTVLAAI
jgi:hypothetical protein